MATIEKLICNLKDEVSKWFYQKGEVDGKLDEKAGTSVASSSGNGLMSSADKVKLDGVATGANRTTVDSALSATSVNPVQNKVINAALNGKANSNHTHNSLSPVALEANVDFNDYKTEGIYILSWTNAQTALNGPPGKVGGRLEVVSVQNGVRQIFHNYGQYDNGLRVYFRNYYASNDEWFDWHTLADNNDIASLDNNKANTGHTHNDYSATVTVPCEYGTVKKFKKNGWVMVIWENIDLTSTPKDSWVTLADIGWSNQAGNRYTGNFQTQDPTGNRFRINENGQLGAWRQKESYNQGHYGYIVYPTAD